MAIEALKGSRIVTPLLATTRSMAAPGLAGGKVRVWSETVEMTAAASDTSTYHVARLPSNARIMGASFISTDDLASTGSPTLDIGCYAVNTGDFTDDVDALNDGIDPATAANNRVCFLKSTSPEKFGKRLWEFINGVTVDPKCEVDVKIVLDDADCNTGGSIYVEIYYTLD
jgi:hypothetical protein